MRAVILAGGRGTRLAPYTTTFPKALVPIGEMPILEIVVRQLRHFGIQDITLAVGHLAELIMAYFGDGKRFGVRIQYSREESPLGTAGPLTLIEGLNERFLVLNGDLLTTLDYCELINYHHQRGALATVATVKREVETEFGVVTLDRCGDVENYLEKPTYSHWVSMGVHVLEAEVLGFLDRGQYLDLPDFILRLLSSGKRVCAYPFEGYWLDIGRPADYLRATEEFDELKAQLLPDENSLAAGGETAG